jgi:hypothetical protein
LNVGDSTLRGELVTSTGVALVGGAAKKSGENFTGPMSMPALNVKSTTGNVIVGDVPMGVPGGLWPNPILCVMLFHNGPAGFVKILLLEILTSNSISKEQILPRPIMAFYIPIIMVGLWESALMYLHNL